MLSDLIGLNYNKSEFIRLSCIQSYLITLNAYANFMLVEGINYKI